MLGKSVALIGFHLYKRTYFKLPIEIAEKNRSALLELRASAMVSLHMFNMVITLWVRYVYIGIYRIIAGNPHYTAYNIGHIHTMFMAINIIIFIYNLFCTKFVTTERANIPISTHLSVYIAYIGHVSCVEQCNVVYTLVHYVLNITDIYYKPIHFIYCSIQHILCLKHCITHGPIAYYEN